MVLKIDKLKIDKETPFHPKVGLHSQIVVLEGDCAEIITKCGFITPYISINRLIRIKKKKQTNKHSKEITLTRACKWLLNNRL